MEPRTVTFEFGTSQPKMPFMGTLDAAPESYTVKKITVNCPKQEMLKFHTEIGADPKKLERQTFISGADINRPVNLGQYLRVVVQVSQFIPEGIKGIINIEIA